MLELPPPPFEVVAVDAATGDPVAVADVYADGTVVTRLPGEGARRGWWGPFSNVAFHAGQSVLRDAHPDRRERPPLMSTPLPAADVAAKFPRGFGGVRFVVRPLPPEAASPAEVGLAPDMLET